MKIKDIMISDAIFVTPQTSIPEVSQIIFHNRFHAVPVVENGRVVGIITEDDFFLKDYGDLFLPPYIKFLEKNRSSKNIPTEVKNKIKKVLTYTARDIMSTDCLTVTPETSTERLMKIIKETKFTSFPVTKSNGTLLGIVTLSDVLGTVKKSSKQMARNLERAGQKKELYKLTEEISNLWHDKITLISKKQVKTWQGGVIIAGTAFALSAFFGFLIFQNKPVCDLEDTDILPISCRNFTYTKWGPCQSNGTQVRKVVSKIPRGCQGGSPLIIQKCR